MATPPAEDGSVSDDRLAAAAVAGVDTVYRMGGAQAIGALAYGTETVPRVDFIAGPGNIYVTLAKRQVYGQVGIESLPGPSEVVIIADQDADPCSIAADLISQAEHNPGSAVLLTTSPRLVCVLNDEIERQLKALPRGAVAQACLRDYGALIVCSSLEECVELTNELAPEHLEIMTPDPEEVARHIRHAGAIFLGHWTPVATGDYIAGPSHVLPTGTTARFSSGLSANDFLKRSTMITYDRNALEEDAEVICRLASAEGLQGHAESVRVRLARNDQAGS
jgi:histidinol dehydrogenase